MKGNVIPLAVVTGVASGLSFCAGSALFREDGQKMSLISGILGFVGILITRLQEQSGSSGKAEMFRAAALQYRLIATQMEQIVRMGEVRSRRNEPDVRRKQNLNQPSNIFLLFL